MRHAIDGRFHEAARIVIAEYSNNAYAVAYAKAMLTIPMTDIEALHTQALYLLSNVSYWRGEVAARTKGLLRSLVKEYSPY